jgi:hypothetical protein
MRSYVSRNESCRQKKMKPPFHSRPMASPSPPALGESAGGGAMLAPVHGQRVLAGEVARADRPSATLCAGG